jgi:iron-sulfur cluster repair protein YtfE (RIC family)
MTDTETALSPDQTVNETVQRAPWTLPVLKSFGIDTCCGGAATLAEASGRHGIELPVLLDALARAVEAER